MHAVDAALNDKILSGEIDVAGLQARKLAQSYPAVNGGKEHRVVLLCILKDRLQKERNLLPVQRHDDFMLRLPSWRTRRYHWLSARPSVMRSPWAIRNVDECNKGERHPVTVIAKRRKVERAKVRDITSNPRGRWMCLT